MASGAFERELVALDERVTSDGSSRWPVEPGRYRLVIARACPWANRAAIVRRLLGLEPVLSMGIAGPVHDERSWRFHLDPGHRDPGLGIEHLAEAYSRADAGPDVGVTVPVLVARRPARSPPTASTSSPWTSPRSGGPTTATARPTCTRSRCARRSTRSTRRCTT